MGILRVDKLSGLETPTAVTGSVAFDGTGDFVTTNFGVHIADSWTMEFWYNTSVNNATMRPMNFSSDLSGSNFVYIELGSGGTIKARVSGAAAFGTVDAPPVNQWHHTALSYDGSTAYFVLNGKLIASQSVSYTNHLAQVRFGADESNTSSNVYTGSISNARLVSGEALYTADYTVPTHAFEVTNGTQILCFNNSDSVTATSNAGIGTVFPLTASGDPTASSDSPPITRDLTYGTEFKGVTTFDTQGYFVPPSGTTTDRDRTGGRGLVGGGEITPASESESNHIDFITISSTGNSQDFGDLSDGKLRLGASGSSTRGIFAGGKTPTLVNVIEYVTIAAEGNAVDFGDLANPRDELGGAGNNIRALFFTGSAPSTTKVIEYVNTASLGDAQTFGDLTRAEVEGCGCGSPTRGILFIRDNSIDYVTWATTGDAQEFGDTGFGENGDNSAASDSTRALIAGGAQGPSNAATGIHYTTISTLGNTQDFGDLTATAREGSGMSNSIRGVFHLGIGGGSQSNAMDYVTIQTTGNAKDFGDLISGRIKEGSACSDSHGAIG